MLLTISIVTSPYYFWVRVSKHGISSSNRIMQELIWLQIKTFLQFLQSFDNFLVLRASITVNICVLKKTFYIKSFKENQ